MLGLLEHKAAGLVVIVLAGIWLRTFFGPIATNHAGDMDVVMEQAGAFRFENLLAKFNYRSGRRELVLLVAGCSALFILILITNLQTQAAVFALIISFAVCSGAFVLFRVQNLPPTPPRAECDSERIASERRTVSPCRRKHPGSLLDDRNGLEESSLH